jgi:hypothetical protein
VLTPETELRVFFRKHHARFRIGWNPAATLPPLEEEQPDGTWIPVPGDVASRFPIRIYSQKQIFELAREPGALLRVVDEAAPVRHAEWAERVREEEARFLSLRAKAREIEAGLAEEPRLVGELADVERKLAMFESAGHSQILREYQLRQQQQRAVSRWHDELEHTACELRERAQALDAPVLDPVFGSTDAEELEVLERADRSRAAVESVRDELQALADRLAAAVADVKADLAASGWARTTAAASAAYEALVTQLRQGGAGDPAEFGRLVQSRQLVEARLREFTSRRGALTSLREQADESLQRLRELRREIAERRAEFLQRVLDGNRHVRIELVPYAADDLEVQLRRLIHCEGDVFQNDVEGLLGPLRNATTAASQDWRQRASAFEARLETLKEHVSSVAHGRSAVGVRDQRFANRVSGLKPEALDRLAAWFPEDSLRVSHSPARDGAKFQPIERGSPGQKTAALLAFLLSYGEEPMLLDQPEDDLDNHLIYDLIVRELREVKRRRQIIVVTHNPNVVVNGDAELTIALHAPAGQTLIEVTGGLQEPDVRAVICNVMEGGRAAFDLRYRRIRGGGPRV